MPKKKTASQKLPHLKGLSKKERSALSNATDAELGLLARKALLTQGHPKGLRWWLETQARIESAEGSIETIGDLGGLRRGQRMAASLRYHQMEIWKCPVRTLELKSRQIGFSTLEALQMYLDTKTRGWSGAVVAHTQKSAEYLFSKFELAHKEDPFDKPGIRTGNVREIRFSDRQGRVEVSTAGSPDALRSRTLQLVHGSECAYWGENGPRLHKAIMKFLGQREGTVLTYETTANGEDPLFFDLWQNAARNCELEFVEKKGAPFGFHVKRSVKRPERWNGFHPLFISVLIDERARLPVDESDREQIRSSLTEEELWLLDDHKVGYEFLKWRRQALLHECNNDLNDLHKEYPVTADQAFVTSGHPRFNIDTLTLQPIEPGRIGYLRSEGPRHGLASETIRFIEEPHSDLTLFRRPEPDHRYVLGADTSEGILSDSTRCEFCSGETDESSIQVYDLDAGGRIEQVGILTGAINEEELVEPVLALAVYFNRAFVVIETQGGRGEHLAKQLEKRYEPARMYRASSGHSPGLKVHSANRDSLIADVASILHDGTLCLHSERTVHQLKQVKRARSGNRRYEAAPGHHDDDLSSLWCVVQGARFYPQHLESWPQMIPRRRGLQSLEDRMTRNPDPAGFY